MPHDVFISYSNKNKVVADAVCAKLEENKIRVWIAPRDVPPGKDFAESIIEAIDGCKAFVLIWSEESNKSGHILNEVNRAFSQNITVIPFRIDNVEPTKSLEYYIGRTHWLDAITPPLEKHIDKLVDTILAILGRKKEDKQPLPHAGFKQEEKADLDVLEEKLAERQAQKQTEEKIPAKAKPNKAIIGLLLGGVIIIAVIAGFLIINKQGGELVSSGSAVGNGAFSDEFNGKLEDGWTWLGEDATHWNLSSSFGSLRIILPENGLSEQGLPHNLLLHDSTTGNFQIETKVLFVPTSNFQFAGLVVYQDNDNALHFGRCFCNPNDDDSCVGDGIYFDSIKSNVWENFATRLSNVNAVFLRLTREENTYTGYYSLDGTTWFIGGTFTRNIKSPRIGLFADQSTVEISADFDYFKLNQITSTTEFVKEPVYVWPFCNCEQSIPYNRSLVLRWTWGAAKPELVDEFIQAIDQIIIKIDNDTFMLDSCYGEVFWDDQESMHKSRCEYPINLSSGTHNIELSISLNKQITDGFDFDKDGNEDQYGPGVALNGWVNLIIP